MSARPREHLDATQGREVVYCHNCENEWYRDTQSNLCCARCDEDITEIVDPHNDPRPQEPHQANSLPESMRNPFSSRPHQDSDSDPEMPDLEYEMGRSVPIPIPPNFRQRTFARGEPGGGDPSDGDDVMERFRHMLMHDFNAMGRPGDERAGAFFGPNLTVTSRSINAPVMGVTATIHTITPAAPARANDGDQGERRDEGERPARGPAMPDFNSIFGRLLGELGGPAAARNNNAGGDGDAPREFHITGARLGSLQDLLMVLGGFGAAPGGVRGDAVYSQEALDQIISRLMDQNPMSNAAPPASQSAIERLARKTVTDEMLGPEGRAECTICIDELKRGDEVLELPCRHWFHGECVTMWLKEHNTCPICRTPIEGGQQQSGQSGDNNGNNSSSSSTERPRPQFRDRRDNEERLASIRNLAGFRNPSASDAPRDRRDSYSPPREPSLTRVRSGPYEGREGGGQGSGSGNGPLGWLRNQFSRDSRGSGGGDQRRS